PGGAPSSRRCAAIWAGSNRSVSRQPAASSKAAAQTLPRDAFTDERPRGRLGAVEPGAVGGDGAAVVARAPGVGARARAAGAGPVGLPAVPVLVAPRFAGHPGVIARSVAVVEREVVGRADE